MLLIFVLPLYLLCISFTRGMIDIKRNIMYTVQHAYVYIGRYFNL